jgi:hypothetical protein
MLLIVEPHKPQVSKGASACNFGSQDPDPPEDLGDKEVVWSQLPEPSLAPEPQLESQSPEPTLGPVDHAATGSQLLEATSSLEN